MNPPSRGPGFGGVSISSGSWWTPERGGLESDASVRALQRWTRVLISVIEDAPFVMPADVCVVVATRTGHEALACDLPALRMRWPGWSFVAVQAGEDTVPLSLVEAMAGLDRFASVVCATVELTPAAELGAALWLTDGLDSCMLRVEREQAHASASVEDGRASAEALNPCAAALELVRGIESAAVSIRVGRWEIHVSSPVPYR